MGVSTRSTDFNAIKLSEEEFVDQMTDCNFHVYQMMSESGLFQGFGHVISEKGSFM